MSNTTSTATSLFRVSDEIKTEHRDYEMIFERQEGANKDGLDKVRVDISHYDGKYIVGACLCAIEDHGGYSSFKTVLFDDEANGIRMVVKAGRFSAKYMSDFVKKMGEDGFRQMANALMAKNAFEVSKLLSCHDL